MFLALRWMIDGEMPTGVPWVRDPEYPCGAFEPGLPRGACDSDGHYICQECKHLKYTRTEAGAKAAVLVEDDREQERRRIA